MRSVSSEEESDIRSGSYRHESEDLHSSEDAAEGHFSHLYSSEDKGERLEDKNEDGKFWSPFDAGHLDNHVSEAEVKEWTEAGVNVWKDSMGDHELESLITQPAKTSALKARETHPTQRHPPLLKHPNV
ncbi:hypothetical protein DFH28DRAFT_936184 [Melampsora americana]|nr:hypothetical protein DFH28DRAFT_936184 [Melampsora americana]